VAYLEFTKGCQGVSETEVPSGVKDKAPVRGLGQKVKLFVKECLNFDILEEKNSKTTKNTIIKN